LEAAERTYMTVTVNMVAAIFIGYETIV
jgi:hypothetical protein